MKKRNGFVTNSSSTVYIITNKTDHTLKLKDFVEENPNLVSDFNAIYDYGYTQEQMIKDAERRDESFIPRLPTISEYGDDDDDALGHVFDYILRDGGASERFEWSFLEFNR